MPKKSATGQYVDGFVLVVPKKNLATYKRMAKEAAAVWMKYGALDYKECVGDDMTPDMGEHPLLTFPKLTRSKEDEVIIFAYIVYKSKKHRDQVNKKVMKDPAMNPDDPDHTKNMPFDSKRMAYGGFKVIVSN